MHAAAVKALEVGCGAGKVKELAVVKETLLLEQAPFNEFALGAADVAYGVEVLILLLDGSLLACRKSFRGMEMVYLIPRSRKNGLTQEEFDPILNTRAQGNHALC